MDNADSLLDAQGSRLMNDAIFHIKVTVEQNCLPRLRASKQDELADRIELILKNLKESIYLLIKIRGV